MPAHPRMYMHRQLHLTPLPSSQTTKLYPHLWSDRQPVVLADCPLIHSQTVCPLSDCRSVHCRPVRCQSVACPLSDCRPVCCQTVPAAVWHGRVEEPGARREERVWSAVSGQRRTAALHYSGSAPPNSLCPRLALFRINQWSGSHHPRAVIVNANRQVSNCV